MANKYLNYQGVECAMNTEEFKSYIANILCHTLKSDDIIIMDKNKDVEKIINQVRVTVQ